MANSRSVQVYAHRGVRSLLPENTLVGYEAALKIGVDWVDVDIVLTKDGEVLASHDFVLNPDVVRDRKGSYLAKNSETLREYSPEKIKEYLDRYTVKKLNLAELQHFDVGRLNPESKYSRLFPWQAPRDGVKMPTLREIIRFVKKKRTRPVGFQIEMKTDPAFPDLSPDPQAFAAALCQVLEEEKVIDETEVQAFDFRCLLEIKKKNHQIKTAYLTSRENGKGGSADFFHADSQIAGRWTGGALVKDHSGSIPKMIQALGGTAWEPEDHQLTQAALEEAQKLGLKVVVWSWPEKSGTDFDVAKAKKMIKWGVDGIITDDSAQLMSLLGRR